MTTYAMYKRAEDSMSFSDAMKSYNKRLQQYDNEVTTSSNGEKRHRYAQSLGMIASAILGGAAGALTGGILGGSTGAAIGAGLGTAAGHAANIVGQLKGQAEPVRNRKEQMAYTNSPEGYWEEILIPGVAGYNRGRTERHIYDTVGKEFDKKLQVRQTTPQGE